MATTTGDASVDIIKELIKAGATGVYDIELDWVYDNRGINRVLELIKAGATGINKKIEGETILYKAINDGDKERLPIIKELIKAGADINDIYRGENALNCVIEYGRRIDRENIDIIRELIKAGVNVNEKNRHVYSPLISITGIRYNDEDEDELGKELIKELIKAGADVEAKDTGGDTALLVAVRLGNYIIFEELIKHGANINA